jgi:prepilin-type N-terminal cleavage/methylation domain-containing protein
MHYNPYVFNKATTNKGFTLVELMIVVAIIGLLAAVGVPAFANAYHKSRALSIYKEFRYVEEAVLLYYAYNGSLPPKVGGGEYQLHEDLLEYLRDDWPGSSTLGTKWKWGFWPEGNICSIRVDLSECLEDDPSLEYTLQILDENHDNGDLHSGDIKLGGAGVLWYYIKVSAQQ